MSSGITAVAIPPQRSCLGNKTEAHTSPLNITRSPLPPQRSCLGNKTEATTTAVYLATALAAQPQRSCLGNKTEAGKIVQDWRDSYHASTKLPR